MELRVGGWPGKAASLGSPVVPFYPFSFWVPFLKPNSRKKGTLIIKGLLGNLVVMVFMTPEAEYPVLRVPSFSSSRHPPPTKKMV